MRTIIRWVLRLYPNSWRARYGDEFEALLEELEPTVRMAANVCHSAAMEHLHAFSRRMNFVATLQTIFILPAALFMGALVLRTAPLFHDRAQLVVMLYANRVWTLWLLLLTLPLGVSLAGCYTILSSGDAITALASRTVAAITAAAFAILAVVCFHMLAN